MTFIFKPLSLVGVLRTSKIDICQSADVRVYAVISPRHDFCEQLLWGSRGGPENEERCFAELFAANTQPHSMYLLVDRRDEISAL
jgi:hypothetical protein